MSLNAEKKNKCSYCGEAPLNHRLSFFESFFTVLVDRHTSRVVARAPKFVQDFSEAIPGYLFKTFVFLKLARLSSDIERSNTFRSRVIWEEARRRGIDMEQVVFLGRPLDFYRTKYKGNNFYFESLPIRPEYLYMPKNWDDKIILKEELRKHSIPVPQFFELTFFDLKHKNIEQIFSKLERPVIIKPRVGSRARHTVTNINTLPHFKDALKVASQISAYLVVEEHINGFICRATLVDGKLAGFYKGSVPKVTGDGVKTIHELIQEKNAKQIERYHVKISNELHDHIRRFGFAINDVLPKDITISLSHRAGQLFGGMTTEMLDDLHPSFLPILEKAAKVVDLSIVGFDCLIPDPTKDSSTQKWAIIECNSLPFIDMHYYALEGKAKNIAGMIWDLWQRD